MGVFTAHGDTGVQISAPSRMNKNIIMSWFRNHAVHVGLCVLVLFFGLSMPVCAVPILSASPVVIQPTADSDYSAPAMVMSEGSQAQNEHHTLCLRACTEKQGEAIFAVYNFEVAGTHTYFVGTSMNPTGPPLGWVWVHNNCELEKLLERIASTTCNLAGKDMVEALAACEKFLAEKLATQGATPGFTPGMITIIKGTSQELGKRLTKAIGFRPAWVAAHHIIPLEVAESFKGFLSKIGFVVDHEANGTFLARKEVEGFEDFVTRHAGNHPGYSTAVKGAMQKITDKHISILEDIIPGGPAGGAWKVASEADRSAWEVAASAARKDVQQLQSKCRELLSRGERIVASSAKVPITPQELEKHWNQLLGNTP